MSSEEDRRTRYKNNFQYFATLPPVPHTPIDGTDMKVTHTAATSQSPSAVRAPPSIPLPHIEHQTTSDERREVALVEEERKLVLPVLPPPPASMMQLETRDEVLMQLADEKKKTRRMGSAIDTLREELERMRIARDEDLALQRKMHVVELKQREEQLERQEEDRRAYDALKAEMMKMTLQLTALTAAKKEPHYSTAIEKKPKPAAAAKPALKSVRTKTVYTTATKKQF